MGWPWAGRYIFKIFTLKKNPIQQNRGGGEEEDVIAVLSLQRCFYGEWFGFRFWMPCSPKHGSFGDLLAV